ncbi:hypothetical protein BG003_005835 [Podila horticola]|nr:hypothetical protein BG003_005835 [Podila horticola]
MTILASPAPPPSHLLKVLEPHFHEVYHVGDNVHVKVKFMDGEQNALYKANTKINFYIQKAIPMPYLNADLGLISAHKLYKDGFKFVALEKYLIEKQQSIPFRVRAHFDGSNSGYSDSYSFKIERK